MGCPRHAVGRALLFAAALALGCKGAQQGYYTPCDEPSGVVLDCDEPPPIEDYSSWDACEKLVRCGVVLAQEKDDNMDATPTPFERCIDQIEHAEASQGDNVLVCIAETSCPDLQRTISMGEDPDPNQDAVEGIIGYCGRLDP